MASTNTTTMIPEPIARIGLGFFCGMANSCKRHNQHSNPQAYHKEGAGLKGVTLRVGADAALEQGLRDSGPKTPQAPAWPRLGKVPPVGLEPTTRGLRVRCSTD